jgi:diguanylate cyclase (GGDEF)-like protein
MPAGGRRLYLYTPLNSVRETDVMNGKIDSGGHPALTDDQTGLPNRLHFETVFEVVFATGPRGIPLTVLVLGIDDYSDWVGRTDALESSRVLRSLGGTLGPLVRQTDLLARSSEAQFVFCLVDCNVAGAVLVADRIDGLLDSIRRTTGLGFSIGGAAFDVNMERPEDLLRAAEESLQVAQGRGNNQMEFHR